MQRRQRLKDTLRRNTRFAPILERLCPPPPSASYHDPSHRDRGRVIRSEAALVSAQMEIAAKELCAVWTAVAAAAGSSSSSSPKSVLDVVWEFKEEYVTALLVAHSGLLGSRRWKTLRAAFTKHRCASRKGRQPWTSSPNCRIRLRDGSVVSPRPLSVTSKDDEQQQFWFRSADECTAE